MTDDTLQDEEVFAFGPFRLRPAQRLLLADGVPVDLTPRAYDILEFLVRNRDHVIGRDEIVLHVWRGVVVGENNLSVQISTLRRVLQAHGALLPMIASVPGRGYRFVAPTEVLPANPGFHEHQAPIGRPAPPAPERRPVFGRRTRIALVIVLIAGTAAMGIAIREFHVAMPDIAETVPASPDPRLSLLVGDLRFQGGSPAQTSSLGSYMTALMRNLHYFEDLKLFKRKSDGDPTYRPHFELEMTIGIRGNNAQVILELQEAASGRNLMTASRPTSVAASPSEQSLVVMALIANVRSELFTWEQSHRRGAAQDDVDVYIDAQVATQPLDEPEQLENALALAEEAVNAGHGFRPAIGLLSYLLTQKMQWSSQAEGEALGLRSLTLLGPINSARKGNVIYIMERVYALTALRRLDDAQHAAEFGLRFEPDHWHLVRALGNIALMKGDLATARGIIEADDTEPADDVEADLAFAEGDMGKAVRVARALISSASPTYETYFTMLMEVAALADGGNVGDAKRALARFRAVAPPELDHLSFLRQSFYALPDPAWKRFKSALQLTGLAA